MAAFDEARRRSRSEHKPKAAEAKLPAGAVGWVIFLAVVTGLAASAVFARQQLVAWVPGAANIYALVGLPVEMPPSARALALRDVTLDRRLVDGQQTLVIVGAIVNATEEAQPVPPLVAKLIDPEGVEIERWTFEAAETMHYIISGRRHQTVHGQIGLALANHGPLRSKLHKTKMEG